MSVMSVYYTLKNKIVSLTANEKIVNFTEKIEELLLLITVLLASIGILKSLVRAVVLN